MGWGVIQVIATVALNALIFGIWKPWGKGYGEEKGKNLARKEDLDGILTEVRVVAIAQKDIEAKITSEVWSRQTFWGEKKLAYAKLFEAIFEEGQALSGLPHLIDRYNNETGDLIKAKLRKDIIEAFTSLNASRAHLIPASALVAIFANGKCTEAIRLYVLNTAPVSIFSKEWATVASQRHTEFFQQALIIAKEDLHVV